ncbi:cystein proteinase inhibitor protein salarin-like [Cylas formicarius]|uniref:cystein proteinase inhibitor protein salarin-like n=1 Tax=Cylas formicarius TaxID=197179 RepID=UPI0029584AE1|nr:cystein proteinase inhibitor protein salarin-like [Cylas formicarius]
MHVATVLLGASLSVIMAAPLLTDQQEWEQFKVKFNRSYPTEEEETTRFKRFQENLKGIKEHNAKYERGETTFLQGVNNFADLTPTEFKQRFTGGVLKKPKDRHVGRPTNSTAYYLTDSSEFLIYLPIQPSSHEMLVKLCLLSASFLAIAMAAPLDYEKTTAPTLLSDEEEWTQFKATEKKSYPTAEEEAKRFKIFKDNLAYIREHNKKFENGETTYVLGVNSFADLTDEEFRMRYTGGKVKFNQKIFNLSAEMFLKTAALLLILNVTIASMQSDQRWTNFKADENKFYPNAAEDARRFDIYQNNLGFINNHNAQYERGQTTYREKHGKSYETADEEANRFKIFQDNLKKIREHNEKFEKGEVTWTQGVNQFTDLTPDEFKTRHTGGILPRPTAF